MFEDTRKLPGTIESQKEAQEISRAQSYNPQAKDLASFSLGSRKSVDRVGIHDGAQIAADIVDQELLAEGAAPEQRAQARELVKHVAVGRAGFERGPQDGIGMQGAVIELDQPVAQGMQDPNQIAIAQPAGQPQAILQGLVQPLAQPQAGANPLAPQQGQFVPAFQLDPNTFAEYSVPARNGRLIDAYRREASEQNQTIAA